MIDGDGINEYGSPAFRAARSHARFIGTDDGRTLLATGHERVDAIDLDTGLLTTGPRATVVTAHGDVVAVAPQDRPDTIALLSLPGLTPRAQYDAGGPVYRLAMGATTIAALTAEPYALAVITDGATHRIDLPDEATCLAVSTDGTLVAVGTDKGRSGNVLVVDATTGTLRHTLTGPRAPVTAVAVSTEHDVVAAAAGPRVLAWTPSAKKPKAANLWAAPKETANLAGFTPSGRLIAWARVTATVSIDPATGAVDWETYSSGPALVHGDQVISSMSGVCRRLDPSTGAVLHTWTHREYVDHLSAVGDTIVGSGMESRPVLFRPGIADVPELGAGHSRSVIAVSFDGDRFATTGEDLRVCVWERGRPSPVFTVTIDSLPVYPHRRHGLALDGGTLFLGDRTQLLRYTVGDPQPQARSVELDGSVIGVASLTDRGEVLVACSKGYRNGALYRLDARTLEIRAQAKAADAVGTIEYTPGSATFDLRWGTGFRTHEITGFTDVGGWAHPAYHPRIGLTPDQALLVSIYSSAVSSTLNVQDVVAQAPLHESITIPVVVGEPCMSPGGLLTTGHADGIRLWDVRSGTLAGQVALRTPLDAATILRWTPDEKAILINYSSGALQEVPL
jgi:outer membrane protein assembly factor BamB